MNATASTRYRQLLCVWPIFYIINDIITSVHDDVMRSPTFGHSTFAHFALSDVQNYCCALFEFRTLAEVLGREYAFKTSTAHIFVTISIYFTIFFINIFIHLEKRSIFFRIRIMFFHNVRQGMQSVE